MFNWSINDTCSFCSFLWRYTPTIQIVNYFRCSPTQMLYKSKEKKSNVTLYTLLFVSSEKSLLSFRVGSHLEWTCDRGGIIEHLLG